MRIANAADRLSLVAEDGLIDVASASQGQFSPRTHEIYDRWDEFRAWAKDVNGAPAQPYSEGQLGAPSPQPRQVFAIGLNYMDHAAEADMEVPTDGMVVFTKFPSSITGPFATVKLPQSGSVDFEAELVVVIAKQAHRVSPDVAWNHVAGLTIGQDISEREMQFQPPTPQFSLGKSLPGFSPMGPVLVTTDEFLDADDLEIGCSLNGTLMQQSRTRHMIFPVPEIIARLSNTVTLLPGDVIFTGTPAGVGWTRDPRVVIQPGDQLVTQIENIGAMRTLFAGQ